MPKEFLDFFHGKRVILETSKHALDASRDDRYGFINVPKSVLIDRNQIIELEVGPKQSPKLVVRQSHNSTTDIIIVFVLERGFGRVKTFWLNEKNDLHKTLDRSRYITS